MCQQREKTVCPAQNMDDIKRTLSRTLSGPKRCTRCHKMVYFSAVRCKNCGEVSHKHCSYYNHHECRSFPSENSENLKPGEEASGPPMPRRSSGLIPKNAEGNPQAELQDVPSPGAAMAGLLKIVHWLSHRRRAKELSIKAKLNSEKHIRGKFGLNLKMEDKEAKKKIKTLIKNSENYRRQMYATGYCGQYQQYVIAQKRLLRSPISLYSGVPSPRSSLSSYSDCVSLSSADTPVIRKCHSRNNTMIRQSTIRWEGDMLSTSTKKLECSPREKSKLSAVSPKKDLHVSNESGWVFNKNFLDSNSTSSKFAKPPCLSKAKTLSIESREVRDESLCATWPPVGKAGSILDDIVDETEADCIEEGDESMSFSDFRSDSQSGEESLKEWYIPFGDIEFKERIRHGRHGDIYKGRWYGEVLIYTIRESCGKELNQFLDQVAQMGMIRHENIVLFMGACIEPQRLAIITSMRKGPTLFEYLHLKRHRLPFHSKHNIARQIAQGMGYLHAKDIIHRKLNSKNIILECRVKLCIMDHGMADKQLDRADYGCIPRGHLSYISPELMSSLQIDPPLIYSTHPYTQESDIFAFGSLLFELLAEKFAFQEQPPHALIWLVSSGRVAPLHNFRFINGLKTLIKRCWCKNPKQRPPFSEIVQILQENVSNHRRHSCSEPDRLHLTGQTPKRTLCT